MQSKETSLQFEQLKEIEEYIDILKLSEEATAFLQGQQWCKQVLTAWHDPEYSIGEKLGIFLFEIVPINDTVDKYIWVILGDLPTVYLDQSVKTGREALEIYCELMSEWAENVLHSRALDECYPVEAEPTAENAEMLKLRVSFIRRELLNSVAG